MLAVWALAGNKGDQKPACGSFLSKRASGPLLRNRLVQIRPSVEPDRSESPPPVDVGHIDISVKDAFFVCAPHDDPSGRVHYLAPSESRPRLFTADPIDLNEPEHIRCRRSRSHCEPGLNVKSRPVGGIHDDLRAFKPRHPARLGEPEIVADEEPDAAEIDVEDFYVVPRKKIELFFPGQVHFPVVAEKALGAGEDCHIVHDGAEVALPLSAMPKTT